MTTEQEMKQWLDGWFFSMDYERGAVTSTAVSLNYIPEHKPRIADIDEDVPRVNGNVHYWDEAEDDLLVRLRSEGIVFKEIALELGLSESTVQKRYIALCTQRGIKPAPNSGRKRKYPPELEATIVKHRSDGKSFSDIADLVKMRRSSVYEIFRTYLSRIKRYQRMGRQAA